MATSLCLIRVLHLLLRFYSLYNLSVYYVQLYQITERHLKNELKLDQIFLKEYFGNKIVLTKNVNTYKYLKLEKEKIWQQSYNSGVITKKHKKVRVLTLTLNWWEERREREIILETVIDAAIEPPVVLSPRVES